MFAFTEESEKKIVTILAKYPEERKMSALLPFLTFSWFWKWLGTLTVWLLFATSADFGYFIGLGGL